MREAFRKICWISLGQTPNLDEAQESLYVQLTAKVWDSDASDDKKKMTLQSAFAKSEVSHTHIVSLASQ